MRLTDLLARSATPLPQPLTPPLAELEIVGLTADSRQVAPGFLFAALPGSKADGRAFIDQAIAKGAVAVLAPAGTRLPEKSPAVALLDDENPRRRLALLAAAFHGQQPATIACVTGTSGKTSVAHFTRTLWDLTGERAASLGTLGLLPAELAAEGVAPPPALTTPDPVALMRCLAELAHAGVQHLAMEASSHGLDQYRLDGIRVAAAAFTNLSHEHLDYHPDMAAYLAAKRRLFSDLLVDGGTAVLNADAPETPTLLETVTARRLRLITFGRSEKADLRLVAQRPSETGQHLELALFGHELELELPLIGDFQAMNTLAALGLALACGSDQAATVAALAHLPVVPGRLELVGRSTTGGRVFVDYAHKPGALAAVLETLRPYAKGRLWVVFGCGGDRDRGKRPLMGQIAHRLADRVIVTDDNPRSENPAAIRREVLAGSPDAVEVGDRRAAIAAGLAGLAEGDILVVAGKGHESGQIVGSQVLPFDDREVARSLIAETGGEA